MAELKIRKAGTSKSPKGSGVKSGKVTLVPYEQLLSEHLQDPDYAVAYLTESLVYEAPSTFLIALNDVMQARKESFSAFAKKAGMTRQGLYKAFSKRGNPSLSTVNQVLGALGMQLQVTKKVGKRAA